MRSFPPEKQRGLIVHGALAAVLALVFVFAALQLFRAEVGPLFTVYLIVALASFFPLPFLVYWGYALWKADYSLDRETLRIVWGLRVEEIPVSDVEWVRPDTDLLVPLALPFTRLPGAVLGMRRHQDLGAVEFLAADSQNLLLVATARQVFAISPADAAGFVNTFQHSIEMGALSPGESHSQYPSFVVSEAWKDLPARYMWLAGVLLNIGLLVWISALIPRLDMVAMGFAPSMQPIAVPGERFILLPLLSLFFFFVGWLAGLYFYRWDEYKPLALLIWGSGVFQSALFLAAAAFLLTTPI